MSEDVTRQGLGMPGLDIHRFPLDGVRLIEASAGTGKTYTIATLFLRLLLERRLEVDQILVVTFTKAATEELRDRIRDRVGEALLVLQGYGLDEIDPVLADLIAGIADRDQAASFLADALTRMDESAVFTIHGFCQRVLQENAFESGAPFDAEFITDETELRNTIVRDFWRRNTQHLSAPEMAWLANRFKTPEGLLGQFSSVMSQGELELRPKVSFAQAEASARAAEQAFVDWQSVYAVDAETPLEIVRNSTAIKRTSYKKDLVAKAIAALQAVMASNQYSLLLPIKEIERFSTEMLVTWTKSGETSPDHPFFRATQTFLDCYHQAETEREAAWLVECWHHLRRELRQRKAEQQMLFFDDLLRQLDDALQAESGTMLADAIRKRFPVAMIDEFQDTDPLQYRIFSTVYAKRKVADETAKGAGLGLFMIGDPKQAIYSFRGADVFTYMQARELTDPARDQFTLKINWRSARGLIRSVEALFTRKGLSRPFIYEPKISFIPVTASDKADQKPLRVDGAIPTPMQFWFMESAGKKADPADVIKQRAVTACAGRIADLLNKAESGQATLGDAPLRARDMAVLVRSHAEGDLIQEALRKRGVASVSLSRQSVFDSQQAVDMQVLLQAVYDPGYEAGVRAALSGELLGRSASTLYGLRDDEDAWERELGLFRSAHQIWASRGFMAAFMMLLREQQIVPRLLARPGGERAVTNLLQLAELTQIASLRRTGMEPLLHWLAEQSRNQSPDDERQLRLESDAALVQIVTIHKSKGLEYPIVFLPFLWSFGKTSSEVLFHDPDDNSLVLDLGSADREANKELTAEERLAESVRLLYVAVTRAKHLCVMPWGRAMNMRKTAAAWLLHQTDEGEVPQVPEDKKLTDARVLDDLSRLAEQSAGSISVEPIPDTTPAIYAGAAADLPQLEARTFSGRVENDWRLVSYSSLAGKAHGGGKPDPETPDHDASADMPGLSLADSAEQGTVAGKVDDIFRFPRGPRAGTFLHLLLEQLDFPEASAETLDRSVESALARHGFDSRWQGAVTGMLTQVLDTDLDGHGLKLRSLQRGQRRDEMEFVFPLQGLNDRDLSALLGEQEFSELAGELNFDPARGLMKGYIDLVFAHEGRFYLADYKSNHLGDQVADYGSQQLAATMRQHQYDLQYLIYSVALHRFLAARIADYDYERDFGGVYYLFLRGMRTGQSTGIHFARPPRDLVLALDRLFSSREEAA